MKLDVVACTPWYVAHLAPVWEAIPDRNRGRFYVIVGGGAGASFNGSAREFAKDIPKVTVGKLPDSHNPTLVASSGDLFIARKAGRPLALMEHGAGQSYGGDRNAKLHSSYAGGDSRDAELFLHPGPHPAQRDQTRYPTARVEIVGSPILDTLPRLERVGRKPVVAVSFHWDCEVCRETRSGFIQFRNALVALSAEKDLRLIGHGHPRILDRLAFWYQKHGIEVVADYREVMRQADVYVCDNSSSLFEFAATGRPVVVLNPGFYRRDMDHGLRFWEAATVGLQVDEPYFLTATIREALLDHWAQQQAREAALGLVYGYRTGAAERAAAILVDWIETR